MVDGIKRKCTELFSLLQLFRATATPSHIYTLKTVNYILFTSRNNCGMNVSGTTATATPAKQQHHYHPRSSNSVGNNEMVRNVKESDDQFSVTKNPQIQLFPHLLDDEASSNFVVHRRSIGTIRLRRRFAPKGINKVSGCTCSHMHSPPPL